ncbi:MAG TPA: GAF domain-containing protein, partial [Casimicrobiaceae bacterium]
NMGLAYFQLGLYRRARRLLLEVIEISSRMSANSGNSHFVLAGVEHALGHAAPARECMEVSILLHEAARDARQYIYRPVGLGNVELWEGDFQAAAGHLVEAASLLRDADDDSLEINCLTLLARARLAAGDSEAALTATQRAAEIHEAHGAGPMEDMDAPTLWWQHHRALAANGKAAARRALARAYRLLVQPISGVSDEGLRRNYLNKIETHREIVAAWIADAGKRKPAAGRRLAHLAGKSNLTEPFERLVDTGLRLNELRSTEELHEFLIDEATELSGAERVLLVLETPQGPRLAGSLVPKGEDVQLLLADITPALLDVRRTRAASLSYVPETGHALKQRSRLVVPLVAQRKLQGYLYCDIDGAFGRFHDADRDLIGMLASQAAVALDNAQWSQGLEQKVAQRTEELQASKTLIEQRASELAIINSVQLGLAAQLDFQAIIDLVGDKICEIFDTGDMSIALYDRQSNHVAMPYYLEHGERFPVEPFPLGVGLTGEVISTRVPLVLNEDFVERARQYGAKVIGDASVSDIGKSYVGVPILSGDEAVGVIALYGSEEHAFEGPSVNLLTTLASSMSVALQNARLFDETQSLLKQTEQRAAELAIINSIQQGVAAELDFQAIIDLVGDKLREVLGTEDIGIRLVDPKTGLVHYLYEYEHGQRLQMAPALPKPGGPSDKMRETLAPVVYNTPAELAASGIGVVPGTDAARSVIFVPIVSGDRMTGSLLLENHEREYAFGDAEVRLLTTVASSMGVALENARLFDETQRLLKETEQRNAELAIINSVQAALAAELNIQGIYDAVGDKIREIFHNVDMGIRIYDPKTNLIHFPYLYENGKRLEMASHPLPERGFGPHVIRTRQTVVVNDRMDEETAKYGSYTLPGTESEKSAVFVPLIAGDQARGLINLFDMEREHAFGESDVRLLQTLANSMSVALENARLFDETQRLLKETEQRAAELAVINSIQEGMAAELDFQAIIDLVGDKLREVFRTSDMGIRWHDPQTNLIHYLYEYEHGVRMRHPSNPPVPGGAWSRIAATRQPIVSHTRAHANELGLAVVPGTDDSLSTVF